MRRCNRAPVRHSFAYDSRRFRAADPDVAVRMRLVQESRDPTPVLESVENFVELAGCERDRWNDSKAR